MKIKSFIDLFRESNQTFEGQESGERVVMILRRHMFVLYSQLAVFLAAVFVPFVIMGVLKDFFVTNNLVNIFIFASTIWYMFFWIAIFYSLTMYSLNVTVVTDHRIVDAHQHGFFDRKISELHLSRVQDISVHTQGIIETAFRFGEVTVQTAGSEKNFLFHQVPLPEHVKDTIMDLVSVERTSHNHSHIV